MNRSIVAVAISAVMMLSAGVAYAQKGQGGGKAKGHVTQPPKVQGGGAGKAAGGGGGHVAKGTSGRPATTTTAKGPKSGHGPKKTADTTTASTRSGKRSSTGSATGPTTTATLTPVQQKLQQNSNLANKLQTRLPAGTNLMTAADGFRNLGQFVAAVNVSNNLGIPFSQLKTRMVDDGMSLGQAIQSVRADVDVTTEVRRAERDATLVIQDSERRTKGKARKNTDGGR